MIIFIIRLGLIAIIALLGIKCVSVGVFGPMFTGYCLLIIAVSWTVFEFICAVEQIVNANKPQVPTIPYAGMSEREVRLIYITEHPNKFSGDQVRHAHLQLDELYYNRIHQKD